MHCDLLQMATCFWLILYNAIEHDGVSCGVEDFRRLAKRPGHVATKSRYLNPLVYAICGAEGASLPRATAGSLTTLIS